MKGLLFIVLIMPLFPAAGETWVPIAGDNVNLRTGPGIEHRAVASVSFEDSVEVVQKGASPVVINGIRDFWYKVRTKDGQQLWIFGTYLALPEKFQPISFSQPSRVDFCIGDWCQYVSLQPPGKAQIVYPLCLGGDCTVEQNRKECIAQHGNFLAKDPEHYGSATCTTYHQVYGYRGILRIRDMYFLHISSEKPCVLMDWSNFCVNRS